MKLSIIIPAFNEKNTILQIVEKIENLELPFENELVLVDDFSNDGTREIIRRLEKKHIVVLLDNNYGKGHALRAGFAKATGDIIVVQDADLEYDPGDFRPMINKMVETGGKVVYGSRRLHHSYLRRRHSGHIFALGGILLTWITNLLYRTNITDEPTCYKMFDAKLLKSIDLKCERFEFCPEVTAKIAKRGIKIFEVPISYYPRHKSEGKKIRFKDFFEAVYVLLKYRFIE